MAVAIVIARLISPYLVAKFRITPYPSVNTTCSTQGKGTCDSCWYLSSLLLVTASCHCLSSPRVTKLLLDSKWSSASHLCDCFTSHKDWLGLHMCLAIARFVCRFDPAWMRPVPSAEIITSFLSGEAETPTLTHSDKWQGPGCEVARHGSCKGGGVSKRKDPNNLSQFMPLAIRNKKQETRLSAKPNVV